MSFLKKTVLSLTAAFCMATSPLSAQAPETTVETETVTTQKKTGAVDSILLAGTVLIAAFAGLGVAQYKRAFEELKKLEEKEAREQNRPPRP